MTLARVRNWTVLKAETALASAVAPAHGPQSLGVGNLQLSEWVRWGNLRPELLRDLLWPPLYRKGRGRSCRGCRHFFTNAGLGSFNRGLFPRNLIDDPCLDRPSGCRGFFFFGIPAQARATR
jgi:hypothetical protein